MSAPLVTVLGASGFVGSAVTAALARRPIRLRAVARRPAAVPADAVADVEVHTADLTVPGAVDRAVAGAGTVILLVTHAGGWRRAQEDPLAERINVGLTRDLVAALRANRRPGPPPVVVFAGSTSQVGLPPRVPIDGTEPDHPVTAYDRQKLAAEAVLGTATARGILRGVSLRLPTVFGAGVTPGTRDHGVVSTMAARALAGAELTLWSDGSVQRDLLYVGDVADAFAAAVDHADGLAGGPWLLGTGRGVSLRELFGSIAEAVSAHTGRPPVPVLSVPAPGQATATDDHSMVVDSSAFRAVTGWRPRTSLRSALAGVVAVLAAEASGRK